MIPVKMGPAFGSPGVEDESAFPVYRENTNKIYLPRFYGIERYGFPVLGKEIDLSKVASIDCTFDKPLRDYQEEIVDTFVSHIHKNPQHHSSGGIIQVPCGRGKTVMSIKILSLIAKKTLIIVHKEFLLNQWVERIRDFLPTAKIGRIQGPVFDSQGKDIVIGMLQTLYDRDFPENAFDDFGLTIIDETHRIGSCQFSKALLRIQTPYMLGVTATLDRKDGLTKVLHMFIGPLVYSKVGEKSEDSNLVLVRGMTFVSNDPEFNNVVVDFRGNPQFSTMISKLCNHGPRTRFIVNMLADLVIENPDAQILILGHNRSLLSDVFDAIVGKGFAEPGMYVGGMKQHLLDISSQKQIVVATFSMAAEALDIPNLSILVMITPKSDIIQSVGRIFRSKHDRKIIVDIVDKHDLFQNQWNKRRIYYKKSGYRIQMTDSIKYKDFEDESAWTTVFDPSVKSVKESSSTKKSGEAPNKIDAESCPFGGKCMIQFDQTELEQETEF
jgi:superfamily II DNA or RNA helicase